MRKFVALALSAAVLVALPTTADARGLDYNKWLGSSLIPPGY